jgi:general secretion pathway protein M
MNIQLPGLLQLWLVRFHNLPGRDQKALLALGFVLGMLVFYLAVWVPVYQVHETGQANRERQLELLRYLRGTETQARAAASGPASGAKGQALLPQISSSTQRFQIKPNRLQPEGSDAVSVWFDAVSFNDLMRWLEQQASEGIEVRQISIDRDEATGKVNARIILFS